MDLDIGELELDLERLSQVLQITGDPRGTKLLLELIEDTRSRIREAEWEADWKSLLAMRLARV